MIERGHTMLELYKNIRLLRKNNGWTQEELASRMGYTDRSMIAKIESGKVDLAQSKILEFAKVFGVTPGDLMDSVETSNEAEKSARNRKFIELLEGADTELQDYVVNLLKAAQRKP